MLEDKTTPRPWVRREGDPSKENLVAVVRGITIYGPYSAASCGADADLIVRAVNAHEAHQDLVNICTGILECLDQGDLWNKSARAHAAGLLRAALAKAGKP